MAETSQIGITKNSPYSLVGVTFGGQIGKPAGGVLEAQQELKRIGYNVPTDGILTDQFLNTLYAEQNKQTTAGIAAMGQQGFADYTRNFLRGGQNTQPGQTPSIGTPEGNAAINALNNQATPLPNTMNQAAPQTGNYPTVNLQPGATGADVKKLQDYLVSQGLMTQAQVNTGYGIYGPQTTAAVKALQERLGVDNSSGPGYWGPRTLAALQGGQGGAAGGKTDPSQPFSDAEYDAGAANNPVVAGRINAGNTLEQIQNAAMTGDLSSLKNEYGQPFSLQEQQDALSQGMEDNRLFYEAQQANDKADTERVLAQKQADYQDSLIKSGEDFQADRANMNQQAVNQGVLFSGSNAQKQAKLQKSYDQTQASNLASYGRDVGNTAQNYQYQYGNDAANGLSQYYSAPTNTFGLSSARGTVTPNGLSSIYNPGQFNFQGTQNVARKTAANIRAASYLGNKGNKLLSTSYNNQF